MAYPQLEEQLRLASLKERELWARVKGHYPGQRDHNEVLWKQWLAAADEVRDLADRMRNSKLGDL